MAKIPRLERQDTPSTVIGGAARPDPGMAGALIGALGKAVEVGYEITADAEAREAKRQREALDKIQAISDDVDGSWRTADFGELSFGVIAGLQEKWADSPEKAIPEYTEIMRKHQEEFIRAAPNTAVGLDVSRGAASRMAADLNSLNDWVVKTKTLKIKGNLEDWANLSVAGGARIVGDETSLEAYAKDQTAKLGPRFRAALGAQAAETRLEKLRSEITYANLSRRSILEPDFVLRATRSTSGPAARYLDDAQRQALERKAESNLESLPENREREEIIRGTEIDNLVSKKLISGDLTNNEIFNTIRAAEKQREVVELDAAIKPDEKAKRLANIDAKLSFYKAAESMILRQSTFEISDKPGVAGEVIATQKKLVSNRQGKVRLNKDIGLADLVKQRAAISQAMLGGAVPQAAGKAMLKQLDLTVTDATKRDIDNDWRIFGVNLPYADAEEVGHRAIEDEFATNFVKATPLQKQDAYWRFVTETTRLAETNGDVSPANFYRIARESASLAMGKDPNGLFKGKAK